MQFRFVLYSDSLEYAAAMSDAVAFALLREIVITKVVVLKIGRITHEEVVKTATASPFPRSSEDRKSNDRGRGESSVLRYVLSSY